MNLTRETIATGVAVGLAGLVALSAMLGIWPSDGSNSDATVTPPPTIAATDLAGGERQFFPELIGVPKDDALEWAEDSGFEFIRESGDDRDLVLIPDRRIVFTFEDGVVTEAVAG